MREIEVPKIIPPAAARCPYRHLAAAVVCQAVRDFQKGALKDAWISKSAYASAKKFLFDTDMDPWLELLELDAETIREKCCSLVVAPPTFS